MGLGESEEQLYPTFKANEHSFVSQTTSARIAAPLIRSTHRQGELLTTVSSSPVLFQPSFTIIVTNVEN